MPTKPEDTITQLAKAAVSALADAMLDAAENPGGISPRNRELTRLQIILHPAMIEFAGRIFIDATQKAEATMAAWDASQQSKA